MDNDEKVLLTVEELEKMLPQKAFIHTIRQAGPILLGSDMSRDKILQLAANNSAELSGEYAQSINHCVAVWDGDKPIFCETIEKSEP